MPREFSYSAKSLLTNNASNAVVNAFKFIGVAILLTFFYFIHKLVSLVFPPFISIFVIIILLYLLLRLICRFITFPGAYWFWRRNVENYFQTAFVSKVQRSVDLLKNLMDYLIREIPWNDFMNEEELMQIKIMITSLLHLFNKQAEHGTLSIRQRRLLNTFNELEELLNRTQIVNAADQKSFSLWSFFEENSEAQDGLGLPNSMLYFRNLNDGHTLLEKCQDLQDRMNDITEKKGRISSLKRWFTEDAFGTIDQVREEMESRYECNRVTLQVDKKVSLDCLFIAGRNVDDVSFSSDRSDRDNGKKSESFTGENDSQYYLQYASKGNRHLKSTVIFCCPNSTYYEFLYYESEWIDLYIRNGLNIFLWNYRGYGRSTGSPDIDAFKKDGEFIVDYLRREMEVKKLGVHGDSIGGIVAAHIAKTKQIDFLCADRNFSSLSRLGRINYGPYLASAYKYLTMRIDDISTDYLESNCYKVLIFDPKDEVVPLLASLKYRVTSKIIAQKLHIEDHNIDADSLNSTNSVVEKLVYPFKKWRILKNHNMYNKQVEERVKNYHDLLSKEQMLALYWAFYRISELFISLSALKNLPTSRKKRANSINELTKSPKAEGTIKFERRGSLDSSVNMSVLKDGDLIDEVGGKKKNMDESTFIGNLNETLDIRGLGHFDDAYLVKTINRKSYAELFDDEAKSSGEVVSFLMKIFSTFEALEAGGIQISDVISKKEKYRFDVFHHFINSFEIWGSYQPLYKIPEDGPRSLSYYQTNSLNKLKEFIKRIDFMIQRQKQKPLRMQSKLVSSVLDDLEIVTSVVPSLYQKLVIKVGNSSSPIAGDNFKLSTVDEVQLDIEDAKQTRDVEGGKFMALKPDTARQPFGALDVGYTGNLVPFSCGHNGAFGEAEIEVCEYHLRASGMI